MNLTLGGIQLLGHSFDNAAHHAAVRVSVATRTDRQWKRMKREGDLVMEDRMCVHQPRCPSAEDPDRDAAHTVAFHPEQGWSLLCNGVVLFEDTGELLPDGGIVPPHRPTYASAA
jgi:hypothetical protein